MLGRTRLNGRYGPRREGLLCILRICLAKSGIEQGGNDGSRQVGCQMLQQSGQA